MTMHSVMIVGCNQSTDQYYSESVNVKVTGITLREPGSWCQIYDPVQDLLIDSIHGIAKLWNNTDGYRDCDSVVVKNSYIDASDDALCFKSHDATKVCQNVVVDNCTLRSSANALKFGTVGRGGFKNFKITNLKIMDTYRSAVTIQAVDGAEADNIVIDGVQAHNVGNAIFLRLGDRWGGNKVPSLTNITIRNMFAEISASKPDSGYRYEGPVEDLPRNISPSGIVGLPDWRIKNVTLSNIEIVYPGGGNPNYAFRGTSKQDMENIPEMASAYPEFSQFKELPAWGFYIRHADNVTFDHVVLRAKDRDYRPAIVADDARDFEMKDTNIIEPGNKKKKEVILNNVTLKK